MATKASSRLSVAAGEAYVRPACDLVRSLRHNAEGLVPPVLDELWIVGAL